MHSTTSHTHDIHIEFGDKVNFNRDYVRLENKPSINGIILVGNKTSKDLSVLSNNSDDYGEVNLRSANKADFLLLTNNRKDTAKMKLSEISSHIVQTVSEIPSDLEVGNYVFLLKEDKG